MCQPGLCCPTGNVACGTVAPGYCHPEGTQCCEGTTINCPDDETCCGDGCCAEVDDEGNPVKCCPGTENGSVCCGEYETCCDGYCMFPPILMLAFLD